MREVNRAGSQVNPPGILLNLASPAVNRLGQKGKPIHLFSKLPQLFDKPVLFGAELVHLFTELVQAGGELVHYRADLVHLRAGQVRPGAG